MEKSNIEDYIDELRGFAGTGKEMDIYSLKKELMDLSESSGVFEDFEKSSMLIGKGMLSRVHNLGSLIKIRNLASEIKNKSVINEKLRSLHFSLNILKAASFTNNASEIKNAINAFLYNNETKIDSIINEVNDFKIRLDKIKWHHSNLSQKSLDNKLETEGKYGKHIEQLHLIHKKQKDILVSIMTLFLKFTKIHIKNLKKFK